MMNTFFYVFAALARASFMINSAEAAFVWLKALAAVTMYRNIMVRTLVDLIDIFFCKFSIDR